MFCSRILVPGSLFLGVLFPDPYSSFLALLFLAFLFWALRVLRVLGVTVLGVTGIGSLGSYHCPVLYE